MKKSDPRFSGVITALVTPFQKGKVDYKSLKNLLRQQIEGGVQGFVVNGTTAESPTLLPEEVAKIFKFVRKEVGSKFPLIMGTGSNSTAETIAKTKKAATLGADAVLVVVPYYNKPPQRGLIAHYQAVAKASKKPVILYNVPGRTVVSMTPETTLELSKVRNIVGIKEASGKMDHVDVLKTQAAKPFLLASGDDVTAIDFILRGGHGVISVLSHVIPREFRELSDFARTGDVEAVEAYKRYNRLNQLLGIEANPMPVKMMLHLMGVIASPELRLPMVALSKENTELVKVELKSLNLI